jgi:predicted small lipoprotein YifL
MHSIKHFSFIFTCFLMSVLLSGCGSKGDLYQVAEPESEQSIAVKESQQENTDTIKKPK